MSATLITVVVTGLTTIIGSIQAVSHRGRKKIRELSYQLDVLEERVYMVRRLVRQHNDHEHPDGSGQFDLPALPEWMTAVHPDDEVSKA